MNDSLNFIDTAVGAAEGQGAGRGDGGDGWVERRVRKGQGPGAIVEDAAASRIRGRCVAKQDLAIRRGIGR